MIHGVEYLTSLSVYLCWQTNSPHLITWKEFNNSSLYHCYKKNWPKLKMEQKQPTPEPVKVNSTTSIVNLHLQIHSNVGWRLWGGLSLRNWSAGSIRATCFLESISSASVELEPLNNTREPKSFWGWGNGAKALQIIVVSELSSRKYGNKLLEVTSLNWLMTLRASSNSRKVLWTSPWARINQEFNYYKWFHDNQNEVLRVWMHIKWFLEGIK